MNSLLLEPTIRRVLETRSVSSMHVGHLHHACGLVLDAHDFVLLFCNHFTHFILILTVVPYFSQVMSRSGRQRAG